MKKRPLLASLIFAVFGALSAFAAERTVVRLSAIDPFLIELGRSLGHFERENLEIQIVKVETVSTEDYLMQEPLVHGRLDASYHWFHHVVFGQRHNLPLKAVLKICDSPGMKVLVANRLRDEVRSAADFRGRNIAEGAGYATKSTLMNLMARRAGVPLGGYTAVNKEVEGRLDHVLAGLKERRVDILAFMEPMTTSLLASGEVFVLHDLTNRTGTRQALGEEWLAQCLFVSDNFIAAHPETVQKLVNAYVRTLRFVNTHNPEEVAARLPDSWFVGKDRAAETARLAKFLGNVAREDYRFTPAAVSFAFETLLHSDFDESKEGKFRRTGEKDHLTPESLYTNRFVGRAMAELK